MTVLMKMQRCSKFLYQSKTLEKKILYIIFSIGLISISSQVYAQEDLGVLIEQQQIIFEVGKHSDVHVKHVIETGAGSQFFIVTKDSTFLDREYTVFGEVTEGMDVADKIVSLDRDQNDCPLEDAKMLKVSISE